MKRALTNAHVNGEAALSVAHGCDRGRRRIIKLRRAMSQDTQLSFRHDDEFEITVDVQEVEGRGTIVAGSGRRVVDALVPLAQGAVDAAEHHAVVELAFEPHVRVQIVRGLIANDDVNVRLRGDGIRDSGSIPDFLGQAGEVLADGADGVGSVHIDKSYSRQVENANTDFVCIRRVGEGN